MSRSWLIALFIALAAGGWVAFGSILTNPDQAPADQQAADQSSGPAAEPDQPVIEVRAMTVSAGPITSGLVLQGRTVADRSVTLRAETDGPVEAVMVTRGERVSAGDEIVRLAVEDREAVLAESEALVRQREIEFDAALRLNQQGYRSETDLAQAQAALDAARARLELARQQLSRIIVRAPFDGVVNDRLVETGDYVRAGDNIAYLIDLDPIRVQGQISERFIGQIELGTVGMVTLVGGQEVTGVVSYIGNVASEQTRTFPIELEIPNPENRVIEGLTAEMRMPTREVVGYRLPSSVLSLADNGEVGVYTVDDGNLVQFHAAQIVGGDADSVWLTGLPETMDLIVVGQGYVRPGTEVAVRYVDELPNRPDAINRPEEAADTTVSQVAREG